MSDSMEWTQKSSSPTGVRKSLRARAVALKHKAHGINGSKANLTKVRSRRNVLKKQPTKLAPAAPLLRLEKSVRYGNTQYNVGDIVSLLDVDDDTYYAQIRGLVVDAIGESCCVLTWLVPTTESSVDTFQPENFIIGMEEDVPRELDCCSLVCRCPADYFRPIASPYSIQSYS